jgi:hypothetical protein
LLVAKLHKLAKREPALAAASGGRRTVARFMKNLPLEHMGSSTGAR